MNIGKYQAGIAIAALLLSVALTLDWLAGRWLNTGPAIVRFGLLGLGLIVSGAATGLFMRSVFREHQAALRYLELLCRLDYRFLSAEIPAEALPAMHKDSHWIDVFDRLRQCLAGYGERIQELEQSRAALEVRARRNETQYQRMASILSSLSEPVLVIDSYDELVLSNPSAEKLFQIDARSTERRALSQLLRCEKLVDLLCDTRRRKTPTYKTGELEITDRDGLVHWYSVTARSIIEEPADPRGAEVTLQGAVAVLRDISVQRAAQKRNAEFVSAVSHEMKTPLSGIKAYVELLVDGDAEDDEAREEFLGVINSQADRLQRLVDNLLNLARIEAGVVSVSKQSRSLNEILEEAFRIVHPAAEGKQIELTNDLSPMYLGVLADRDMLLQAAINLLSNAIKYTPDGGRVTLRSRLAGNEIHFEVEDTGVGLSPEDCGKVFEKFYRVQQNKDMASGTGLGLPLAKHIIEDVHSGKLTVESELGRGSTFAVTLPSPGQLTN